MPVRHRRQGRSGAIRRVVGHCLAWSVVAISLWILAVAVVMPRLAGGTALTILTGSMSPGMPPGTLVVVRPIIPSKLKIGDVVTYQIESGKPEVVTHRLVGISFDGTGRRVFTARGDANGAADPRPVRSVQIRGVKWYSVPHLGWVNSLLSTQQRGIARLSIAAILLAYALWMIVSSVRERRAETSDGEQ